MAETADLVAMIERLTPQAREAVTRLVAVMTDGEGRAASSAGRPKRAIDLLGKYDDGSVQLTMEDFRSSRDEMAAEFEASWAERGDRL